MEKMSNTKKWAKLALGILLILTYCLMFTAIKVHAKGGSYSINSATFDVQLEDNGDATVTESWQVNFSNGTFTRFYKDIYKNVKSIEQFDSIEFEGCWIDGIECERVSSMDREDYHYYIEEDRSNIRINWFKSRSGGDRYCEYKIRYRISNILKRTDNDNLIFCYRFIGKEFKENVSNAEINIATSNGQSPILRFSNEDYIANNIVKEPIHHQRLGYEIKNKRIQLIKK